MEGMEHNLGIGLKDALEAIQTRILGDTYYFGVKTIKCPLDFWVYQEIIWEVQPDVIVEIGNFNGGSTLGLAHILDHLGQGKVIGVDIDHGSVPDIVKRHPRVRLITGDACAVFDDVKALVKAGDRVIIIEDSSHECENTLNILRKYGELVSIGSYFIIEDSICHHGLNVGPDPGPYEAIERFLRENDSFAVDRTRESFFITWNPKGFLKRVKGSGRTGWELSFY